MNRTRHHAALSWITLSPNALRSAAVGAVTVLALAGCSSTDSGTEATSSSSATSPSAPASTTASSSSPRTTGLPAGAKQLAVTLTGKKVVPAPAVVQLARGQVLRLTVTSDHADELHAHGFEKEAELVAGTPTTIDLVTDQPGTYEVETHHPELRLFKVQVR